MNMTFEEKLYKKWFIKSYHNDFSGYNLFLDWRKSRRIVKKIDNKKDIDNFYKRFSRGSYYQSRYKPTFMEMLYRDYNNINYFIHRFDDHRDFWQDTNGQVIMTSHPYSNEFDEIKLIIENLKLYLLSINVYDTAQSWYYPQRTLLIELKEKVFYYKDYIAIIKEYMK